MAFFSNLAAEAYDRAYSDRQIVQRLAKYFSAERTLLFGVFGTVLVLTLLGLLDPIIVSRGLDAIKTNPTERAVLLLAGVLLLFAVINWGFYFDSAQAHGAAYCQHCGCVAARCVYRHH